MKFSLLAILLSLVSISVDSSFAADLKERHGRTIMARERTAATLEKKLDDKAMAQLKTESEADKLEASQVDAKAKLEARRGRAQMTRELAAK